MVLTSFDWLTCDGVRVIYFNGDDARIWLLIAYAKAKFDNLPSHFLAKLKEEVERG